MQKLNRSRIIALEQLLKLSYRSFDATSKYEIYFLLYYIFIYIYICIFIFDSTSNPFPLRVFPLLPLDQVGLGENDQPKRLTVHLR